jgi:hypothetical protein
MAEKILSYVWDVRFSGKESLAGKAISNFSGRGRDTSWNQEIASRVYVMERFEERFSSREPRRNSRVTVREVFLCISLVGTVS